MSEVGELGNCVSALERNNSNCRMAVPLPQRRFSLKEAAGFQDIG